MKWVVKNHQVKVDQSDNRDGADEKSECKVTANGKMGRSEWISLLANIATLIGFCSANQAGKNLFGQRLIFRISQMVMFVFIILVIWEIGAIVYRHLGIVRKLYACFYEKVPMRLHIRLSYLRIHNPIRRFPKLKFILPVCCLTFTAVILMVNYYCPETSCYASVSEIYGLPVGAGDPLSKEERQARAFYWEIKEYPLARRVVLNYKEPYGQTELLRKYSTAYNMELFLPCAKVEYHYRKNRDRFLSSGQESMQAAKENGYREMQTASYYGSDGKLLMRLDGKDQDRYEISTYSAEDVPQLFQSTLFRAAELDSKADEDARMDVNDLTMHQIQVGYDLMGRPVIRRLNTGANNFCGVNGERYEYNQENRLSALWYIDAAGQAVCNNQGIMLIRFTYDLSGNLKSISYFSDENGTEKTEGFYGVFREEFEYDADGNRSLRKQLDRKGNKCYDENNVCTYRYTYKEGKLVKEEYLGLYGDVYKDNDFHSGTVEFADGQKGKDQKISIFFDFASKYVGVGEEGNSLAVIKQLPAESVDRNAPGDELAGNGSKMADYEGKEMEETPDDQFTLQKRQKADLGDAGGMQDGFGVKGNFNKNYSSIVYLVDHRHRILEEAYCDREGNFAFNEQGYALRKFQYDDKTQIINESFCGIDGQECLTNGGYAAIQNTYVSGQCGVIERKEYLGIDGKRTLNRQLGYASVQYDRSSEGENRKVVRTYLDAQDCRVRIPGKDYAIAEKYYDEIGHLVRESYYDEEGLATNRSDYGIAEIIYEYDENGNQIRESYKDVYGDPANRSDTGVAACCKEFEDGRLKMIKYQGYQDQRLVNVANKTTGASMVKYTYEQGRTKQEEYFDIAGNSVLRKDTGYNRVEYEYNEKGEKASQKFYGTDGNLILCKDQGYAVAEFEYNELGQGIRISYLDTDMNPIINSQYHCAGVKYAYDDRGNRSDIYYLGLQKEYIERRDLGIAHIRRVYDQSGNLIKESYYDAAGNPSPYRNRGYASFENIFDNGRVVESRFFDVEGNLVLYGEGGYAIIKTEYDSAGRKRSEKYYGENSEPVISAKYHCAGFQYDYDAKGNRSDIRYLGTDGEEMIRQDLGYARCHSDYDEMGNEIRAEYYDEEGNPAVWAEGGCFACEFDYDHGNRVVQRYLDIDGKLMVRKDTGYSVVRKKYDDFGRCISVSYFDTEGQPVISKKDNCAGLEYRYDEMGRCTDTFYLGFDGKPMVRRDYGYANIHTEYDEVGNEKRVSYFDAKKQRAIWKQGGYAFCEYEYDEYGKRVKTSYFDQNGNAVVRRDMGYAVRECEYDAYGDCIAEYYYGIDHNPVISTYYQCAGRRFEYDERGRRTDTSYLGLDGNLMIHRDRGYARIHSEYDIYGNETKCSYYDVDDKPTIWKKAGNAFTQFLYQGGNHMESRYLDKEENLRLREDEGYAVIEYAYDANGNRIKEIYLDTEHNPVINRKSCCAGIEYQYDKRGNMTDIWYLDLEGQPMVQRNLGYAHEHLEYDVFDHMVETSYYDAKGDRTVRKEGRYFSCKQEYNDCGQCIEKAYFGLEGELVLNRDGYYSVIQYEYDELGQCAAEYYLGTSRKPIIHSIHQCAGRKFTYDGTGNQTDIEYLNLEKAPMVVKNRGYAREHMDYDDFGNEVKVSCLDLKGEPAVWSEGGYATCESTYRGKLCVEKRYLDTKGELSNRCDTGYALIKYTYDAFGKSVGEEYFDSKKERVLHTKNQYAGVKYAYDESGNCTDKWLIGLNGEGMICEAGYAHVHSTYDIYGKKVEEAYRGLDEQPVALKDSGYAFCKYEYANGRCIKECYLDADKNPVLRGDTGYAEKEWSYDQLGQCSWEVYRDEDEWIMVSKKNGCAGISYQYDDRGNKTYTYYRDKNWDIIEREDLGIALNFMVYDAYGHLISDGWYTFNPDGDETWKKTVNRELGYAVKEDVYEGNTWLGRRYWGADGELIMLPEIGYAMQELEYNDANQVIRTSYYDAEKNLINYVHGNVGEAVIEYFYDSDGKVKNWIYYNKDNDMLKDSYPPD